MNPADGSLTQLSDAVRAVVVATDRYTSAASTRGKLHRTDLTALAVLMDARETGMSPGRLGSALNLSSPATTALVDRLERAGHVTRARHEGDRRAVDIRLTDQALTEGSLLYFPLYERLTEALGGFSDRELETATRIMLAIAGATDDATVSVKLGGLTKP